MSYRNKVLSVPWHLKYPFKQKIPSLQARDATAGKMVIVDIGGNQGVDLERFASCFPHLDCDLVLQDLPETLSLLKEGKSTQLDARIRVMEYDFLTAQPVHGASIRYTLPSVINETDFYTLGANIYYLKSVLHELGRFLILKDSLKYRECNDIHLSPTY
jgi:hypothetical protein